MTLPRALTAYTAAATPAPAPASEPAPAADAGFNILNLIITYPWWALGITVALIIAGKVGIDRFWAWLTLRYNISGKPLNKLNVILANTRKLMYSEDIHPVFLNNPKLVEKYPNFTWVKFWRAWTAAIALAAIAAIVATHTITWIILGVVAFVGFLGVGHLRQVATFRHQLLMQMFEVAQVQFRYAGGAELNPWAYIIVSEWNNVYFPSQTTIMIPAKVRKDDARVQKAFEEHFSSTVSDQYTWTFEWAPAANKVTATPVPKLPESAPYPFPDTHPWDEFPLGLTLGGGEAVLKVSVFPHLLVAGTTGSGKLLRLGIELPTPTGWTTVGDIRVGDQVLDENGNPCTVTGLSEINEQPDLYRVTFSDGSFLDADGDHLWWTETRQVRESRWNTAKKTADRRPLLDPAGVARLRAAAAGSAGSEIRLSEAAAIAGVSETLPWVQETAAAVGHTGEVQVVADFEYAEQVVVQKQKVTEFPARQAWAVLAGFEPKVPAWYAHRARCAELAAAAGDGERVSSRDVAQVLGVAAGFAGAILRQYGVAYEVGAAARGRGVAMFPAREAWQAIADARTLGEQVAWLDKRAQFAANADAAGEDDVVTSVALAEALGYASTSEALVWMKKLGVPGRVVRRDVELRVPAKTVRRAGRWARTYPADVLLTALADRGEKFAHDQRHRRAVGGVRTTREILATLYTRGGQANHAVPVAKPLDLPEADLPIAPYLLGVWLGDGSSRHGSFVGIDHEIAEHLRNDGHEVTEKRASDAEKRHEDYRIWTVAGLHRQLRETGLLRKDSHTETQKRIPAEYLRASIAQRRALLAGLLDTDGTVAPQGTVQFTNTNRDIAFGVHELAVSLGYRATIVEGRAKYAGEDYGPKWTVAWTCAESPFRLSRKTAAHRERNTSYSAQRNDFRYIVSIEPIESVPGRCLMVDSPNRLFLAGRNMVPTHNSVTQRTLLLHALQSPEWRVVLIDPKRVELSAYRDHPNVLRVAVELDESLALIEQLEQEMQSRYVRMQDQGVNHFKQLDTPLPAVLCMVDETFSLLAPTGIKSEEGKEQDAMKARIGILLSSIARLGRAAGVHLILATQRPDAKVLPGELKPLAVDTPIPTPSGWKTMGELAVGDEVFDEQGRPTKVVKATEVMTGHTCYRVEFSDGSSIVADADHRWVTHDVLYRQSMTRAAGRRRDGLVSRPTSKPSIVSTEDIFKSLTCHGKTNHAVPVAAPLDLPDADLPVAPYTLGAWLGDGTTGTTNITSADEQVRDNIRADGYDVWANKERRGYLWRIAKPGPIAHRWAPGLKGALRDLGVLNDKHIPTAYLRGSIAQRRALLAGLLDTDGSVVRRTARGKSGKPPAGQVHLDLANEKLARGAYELICSLGYQATIIRQPSHYILDGVRHEASGVWAIRFTPHEPVFRLDRKVEAQGLDGSVAARGTTRYRYITDVVPVETVPVRCIAVDADSHLFLAGPTMVPTHNSNLDARIAQGRMDTTPSLMTLDSDAATKIPPVKGRAVARMGRDTVEFQAYFLSEKDLSRTLTLSKSLASGDKRLLELAKARQGGGEAEEAGGGRRFSMPKVSLPKVSLPAGLREKVDAWVAKRQAVVEENEARAGRTPEAREKRAKKREAARNPALKPVSSAGAGGPVAGDGMSVAEVAEAARAKGITSSMGLFDKAAAAGGSPELFAGQEGPAVAAVEVEAAGAAPVAGPAAVPVTPVVPAAAPATPVAVPVVPEPVLPVVEVSVPVQLPVEEPAAPLVEAGPPVPPAAVERPVATIVASLSVADVLARAQERGVKIPASELLAALRAEALREQAAAVAAPAGAPEPVVPVVASPVQVAATVVEPAPVVEAPPTPPAVPVAAPVAAPAAVPAVPVVPVVPAGPPPAPPVTGPRVVPPPPPVPVVPAVPAVPVVPSVPVGEPWVPGVPAGSGVPVAPAAAAAAGGGPAPVPVPGDGPVRPAVGVPAAPAVPVAPAAPAAPAAAAAGAAGGDDEDDDGPPPFSAPWMPTEIYRPPTDRPSPFAPPPQR